jgi:sugar lactone lactonase YvrE
LAICGRQARGGGIVRLTEPNRLWGANGVSFGPDGRLYVAQFLAGQISAVDLDSGDVESVVALDSPVQTPDDLAFDTDGAMYIADLAPGRVWRRTSRGEFTLVSDDVVAPNGITCVGNRLFVNEMRPDGRLFELPPADGEPAVLADDLALGNAMQIGPDGYLYYPHMMTNQVWRVAPDGDATELVADQVDAPVAVRFDLAGVLVVLSRGPEGLITRIDLATGRRSVLATGIAGLDNAAFDRENRMFVSSFARGGIAEIAPDGRAASIVRPGMNGPFGIASDRTGKIYLADHFSVASVGDSGAVESTLPSAGGLPVFVRGVAAGDEGLQVTTTTGQVHSYDPVRKAGRQRASGLSEPFGICVGPDGEVVVAESGAGRVLRINAEDTVTVLAEELDHPLGVVVYEGSCYVTEDRLGQVIRLEDGVSEIVADGLGRPQGIAIRGDDLFVVEVEHRWLRRISLSAGTSAIEAGRLPVGLPPGIERTEPAPAPGGIGRPAQFADVSVTPDGSVLLSANGEGSVLRLNSDAASRC